MGRIAKDSVTFILTSCGRVDLLEKTLDSFLEWNDYPIEKYIITEDSANPIVFEQCERLNHEKYDGKLEFIFNETKLGQTASIDKAYQQVKTPFVFHCEEDWLFYRNGFIQQSIDLLKAYRNILQAWIRPKSDGHVNRIAPLVFSINGVPFRKVLSSTFYTGRILETGEKEIVSNYNGFSFNPGLKRMEDYKLLGDGGYSKFKQEHLIDYYYRDLGFIVVALGKNDDDGWVKHIGNNRRVKNTKH